MKTLRKRHQKKKQHAGAMVGEGTYGCGFIPSLRCENENVASNTTFSKLMNKTAANEEISSVARIKQIDPEQQYTVYPIKQCKLKRENIKLRNGNLNKCTITKKYNLIKNENALSILQAPVGGVTLAETINAASTMGDKVDVFIGLTNLFKGLTVMHARHFYHMDIKENNIVVQKNDSLYMQFIDFGLSIDFSKKIESATINTYLQNYFLWPLELRFIYIVSNPSVIPRLKSILYDELQSYINDPLKINLRSHGVSYSAYYKSDNTPKFEASNYLRYIQYLIENKVSSTKLIAGANIYGMGLLMNRIAYIIFGIFMNDNDIFIESSKMQYNINDVELNTRLKNIKQIREFIKIFGRDYLQLGKELVHPDVLKRPTAEEAYNRYIALVSNLVQYKNKISMLTPLPESPKEGIIDKLTSLFKK